MVDRYKPLVHEVNATARMGAHPAGEYVVVLASDYAAHCVVIEDLKARCRELEARACKHHIAMTMQDACRACGQPWQAHSTLETFVKPQPMLTTTKCWKCGEGYDITAPTCPHCGAVNANVDPDKASADCLEFQANRGGKDG